MHLFPAENHGLRLGGADFHPYCFTLSCKPSQCNRTTSSAKSRDAILRSPNQTFSSPQLCLEILSMNITNSHTQQSETSLQSHRGNQLVHQENCNTAAPCWGLVSGWRVLLCWCSPRPRCLSCAHGRTTVACGGPTCCCSPLTWDWISVGTMDCCTGCTAWRMFR